MLGTYGLRGCASMLALVCAGQASAADPVADPGDDIVVTAQKIEQRAVDVPITISAIGGDRLRELGVSDLDELSSYVPGLNIQEQSANNPGIVIRGITSDSGSAQQAARVTLYYNGVDISRSRGSYQDIYAVTLVNVRAGLSFANDAFELAAFARNVTNRNYLLDAGNTGGSFGYPTYIPAEPRLYGAQITARF